MDGGMALASTSRKQEALFQRLCVGGLACVLQIAGLAHFFLVAHEVCPEHGELVHARWREAGSHASVLVVTGHDALTSSQAKASVDDHEHCSVFLHRRSRALEGPRLGPAEPQVCAALPSAPAAVDVPAAVPVLFFAPKSSPPIC